MSGTEFEHFTADVFAALGYGTRVLGGSGDQGVDVIAEGTRNGVREKLAIQCKQYDKPVGNAPVQQVLAAMIHHGCTKGVVVAPMGFTRGAKELANSVGVELHDAFSLRTWIMRAGDSGNSETTNERQQGTRFVDLTDESSEVVAIDHAGDMERNEVYVGTPGVGETVAFTGRSLGRTAHVNNGEMQVEFYVLPDGRYRAHVTYQDVQALYPSDMTEAFADGRPVNYGKWTEA